MASNRNGRASGWIGWLRRKIAGAGCGRSLEEVLRRLTELEEKVRQSEEGRNAPIVIEHVRIDKVVVDKIEHHNNFGALGIKELGGKLNIGANYILSEDKLPPEGAAGLEALRQAEAAARRDRGSVAGASGAGRKAGAGGQADADGGNAAASGRAGAGAGAARGSAAAAAQQGVNQAGASGVAGPKVGIRGQPSSFRR